MPDESYSELQAHLAQHPDAGDIIEGSGGIRKLRRKLPGTGKRGGVRVIYFWRVAEAQILMLTVYRKADKDDLTEPQKRLLRRIVENW
ncbi:MAG: transcription elongation factor GreB [Hydrocarboniphaga sp.]|uniref:type II toxin-antitoxin system RelE/ParE family toxin n=1 Tax=Hydrocarboniphaga sp. TaxID=2033016 RepID=UPI002623D69A|nr:type II toxin-antitoxin system RelE/ParE family toxin [Hydrocarboniphaga sp.]MDB5973041.1 transcription elongation factor GreB [Hydrocarboniphaga sp.]